MDETNIEETKQKTVGKPFYDWSKEHTKQVRVNKESYDLLKKQTEDGKRTMMFLLDKIIKENYGNE